MTPTKELSAWLDLVNFRWQLLEYRRLLLDETLTQAEVTRIRAQRDAMTKLFHERDALRDLPVMKQPLIYGPAELKGLYEECQVRTRELGELERKKRSQERSDNAPR